MPRRRPAEPTRQRVARHILALRKARNLSQAELALAAGLDRSYVGSIERGERNISADNIDRLAHALDVDVVDLVAPRGRKVSESSGSPAP